MLPNLRKISSLNNSKSNRLMSCLSISTMCLLITASIVIITVISITPIIILSLGQINAGQRDLILEPEIQFMNSTKIQELSGETVLPRLKTYVRLNGVNIGTGWFMDLNGERENHLGTIGGDEPDGHRNVYAHSSFQIPQGQQVTVELYSPTFLRTMMQHIENRTDMANKEQIAKQIQMLLKTNLTGKFMVKQVFSDAMGKFPIGEIYKFIYMDINSAFQQIVNDTFDKMKLQKQSSPFITYINDKNAFDLGQYSTEATINVPDRIQVYSSSDYEKTYDDLSSFGSKVTTKIGLFSVQSSMPIASNLIVMGYFGMFIGVVLKLIIVSLFILSAIMMNNMLTMGVQTKQFDMALFKTVGANRVFLVLYLLIDSLKYVLISNFIAFPFAYGILRSMTDVFQQFFGYKYEIYPTPWSIVGGLLIGILVPLVSAITPMKDIFKNNSLVEHLNPVRNKTQAIHTQIYVEGKQFPYGQFIFGLLATMFGLMIYYLLPKGLINQDITLLLLVFFIILQGLLIGMVLIGFSFQYLLEKIIAYGLLFWVNKTDFLLMLKNLSAHRFKNRRSSILYAFSVSFIVFVSVGLQIQIQTIYNQLLKKHGSFVEISGQNLDRKFYDDLLSKTDGVQDWAYQSISLTKYLQKHRGVTKVMISDQAKLYFAQNQIFGVSPNIMKTWYADDISMDRTLSKSPYDPYSYLYTLDGHNTSTLSKYVARKFHIYHGDNRQYLINYYWPDKVLRIPMNYSTVFSKRAVLAYNAFSKRTQIGVSMDKFRELAGIGKYEKIPLNLLKIKIRNPLQSSTISAALQRQISTNNSDKLWEYSELRSTIQRIENLLTKILNILLVVVLVISFFSLITTSYLNIINQSLQIGILLTLGYDKGRITSIYIYQTFVLVINSCLIGIAVGWFVAWMMGLQRDLFADFDVYIQINGLGIIFVSAILSSLLSTFKPLRQIFSRSISQVLNYS